MIDATSINDVISQLDKIIDWSRQHKSRIGYFACLYRKMTVAVREGISNGNFEDGHRMELLDTIFANRYLQAGEAYINKQKCRNAWCAAFDSCNGADLVVLQHLLLGINTHINLDLGIAAAQCTTAEKIYELESDFNKINDIISLLTKGVQDDLCTVWPPLYLLTNIADHTQDAVLNFSITAARKASWTNAVALSMLQGEVKESYIDKMDATVCILAERIKNPGFAAHLLLKPVVRMESKNVNEIIDVLYN